MSEKITHSPQEVNEVIESFETQFATQTTIGQLAVVEAHATFGEQLMEQRDFKNLPVATGGPTWAKTGMTQDQIDGDEGGKNS